MLIRRLPRSAQVSAVIAIFGLVAVAVGGFLPWVRLGTAERNVFESGGLYERFPIGDVQLLHVLFTAWIAVPLVCVVCVGLYLVGLVRTGAGLTIFVALLAGTVGAATYVLDSGGSGSLSVVGTGPLTTCFGGVVALAGSLGALSSGRGVQAGRASKPAA